MSEFKHILKSKLRYHRLAMIAIVLTYIIYKYNFSETRAVYDNGQPKYDGEYVNGMNEGVWTWYYYNGNKQIQGPFKKGRRNGTWKMWNLRGTLVREERYETDKLNGPFTEWYDNGSKKCEGAFENDKLSSELKLYDSTGALTGTKYYTNGVLIK